MTHDEALRDLVEEEGVNAGSRAAERDRRASGHPPVGAAAEAPTEPSPPPERLIGPPEQGTRTPGQELAAGGK
jgi:hypothetical protein